MPYVRDESASPPRRHLSQSPDEDDQSGPSKTKKARITTTDIRRKQLDKLFANPEKEVVLPTGTHERTLRPAAEMMKNVQGSSAGAGSGEFHVYKQARRREYERLRIMSDKTRALEEQAAFKARQAERDAVADAKTAKNRAKRMKRKGKKGENGKDGEGEGGGAGERRKLAGGGRGVVFKRPGEEDEGSGQSEEEDIEPVAPTVEQAEVLEAPRVIEEAKIVIHDD